MRLSLRIYPAVVAALFLGGCEPTAPPPPNAFQLSLGGPATITSGSPPGDGLECGLQLSAIASGTGSARWTGARFRYLDLLSGELLASNEWDAAGVRSFWSAERIAGGERLESRPGAVGGPVNFVLEVAFDYVEEGRSSPQSAVHSFTCTGK